MFQELTCANYELLLDKYFSQQKIVLCSITTSLRGSNCIEYKKNVDNFNKKHPHNTLIFCYVDYVKYNILQNYYQLNNLTEYPKTIIFYGNWDNKDFVEGPLSVEELEEIWYNTK